jgi:hypothetical protein
VPGDDEFTAAKDVVIYSIISSAATSKPGRNEMAKVVALAPRSDVDGSQGAAAGA